MYYDLLDKIILHMENKLGRLGSTVASTVILMMAAAVYVRPAIRCTGFGVTYAKMSENPFVVIPENNLGFRILTPLISYLIGLRGTLIIVTNLILATLLVGLVYQYFRSRSPRPGDAFLGAAVITFSLVTLSTIYYGGYCDSLTYLIVFLMWWLRPRRLIFYMLFFLGLLNHESIAFLAPWFAYLSFKEFSSRRRWLADLAVGFGPSIAIYLMYRAWMSSRAEIGYSMGHYLVPILEDPLYWLRISYPYQFLGFFTVFKANWIFPVVAMIALWRMRRRDEVFSVVLLICCTAAQLVIAYDSSRMLTLCFMAMIISLERLFAENPFRFREWAGYVVLINLLVPQLFTAKKIVETMHSTIGKVLQRL